MSLYSRVEGADTEREFRSGIMR